MTKPKKPKKPYQRHLYAGDGVWSKTSTWGKKPKKPKHRHKPCQCRWCKDNPPNTLKFCIDCQVVYRKRRLVK